MKIVINLGPWMFLCTALFVALKLTDAIDWGWLWVLSPLWLPTACGLAIVCLFAVFTLAAAILVAVLKGRR